MNALTWGVAMLRGLSLLFRIQGRAKESMGFQSLADAAESGIDIDEHMKQVAANLKAGIPVDWNDITTRIESASSRLQAPQSPP